MLPLHNLKIISLHYIITGYMAYRKAFGILTKEVVIIP